MEPISKLLRKPTRKAGARSERAELIGYFTDTINAERSGTKFKPVSPAYVATKVAHLSKADLYYVKSQGEDYRARHGSFSKYFFGSLKARPEAV